MSIVNTFPDLNFDDVTAGVDNLPPILSRKLDVIAKFDYSNVLKQFGLNMFLKNQEFEITLFYTGDEISRPEFMGGIDWGVNHNAHLLVHSFHYGKKYSYRKSPTLFSNDINKWTGELSAIMTCVSNSRPAVFLYPTMKAMSKELKVCNSLVCNQPCQFYAVPKPSKKSKSKSKSLISSSNIPPSIQLVNVLRQGKLFSNSSNSRSKDEKIQELYSKLQDSNLREKFKAEILNKDKPKDLDISNAFKNIIEENNDTKLIFKDKNLKKRKLNNGKAKTIGNMSGLQLAELNDIIDMKLENKLLGINEKLNKLTDLLSNSIKMESTAIKMESTENNKNENDKNENDVEMKDN